MSVQGKRITCKAVTFLMGCRNKFGMTGGVLISEHLWIYTKKHKDFKMFDD
jgi:hypothetical protein